MLIGQRLNVGGSKAVADAVHRRNAVAIKNIARHQAEAGADYLDICAAGADEPETLRWLVETAQSATDIPLCLDSQNPAALRCVLPLCKRPPILNCFSGAPQQSSETLSLIRDWRHLPIIAVCYDGQETRTGVAQRVEIAARLVEQLTRAGVGERQIILDPVTVPMTCGSEAEATTLATLEALHRRFPSVRLLCAVSNYSFGLPQRCVAECEYGARARAAGADTFLCDVGNPALRRALRRDHIHSGIIHL